MLTKLHLMPITLICASSCTSAPLDDGKLNAINEALANRAAIAKKCGIAEPDRAAAFLREASKRIEPAIQSHLAEKAAQIIAGAQAEEAEYICTPEMFDHSQSTADKAQADWDRVWGGDDE